MNKNRQKGRGLPLWKVALPTAIILIILHATVIASIFMVSSASSGITAIMQKYSGYISDVTRIQGGSSYLSESSLSFVLHPVREDGTVNTGPLSGYANEFKSPRRGNDILKLFADRDVAPETMQKITLGAQNAEAMTVIQLHAIALTVAVYPVPEGLIADLPLPELTAEEQAMTDEQKLKEAFELISGDEYSQCKRDVSTYTSSASGDFSREMQINSAAQIKKVNVIRTLLWVATISVIGILALSFIILIKSLVLPLRGFVRGINAGSRLREHNGLAEVRLVARSYNALLGRKTALEDVLRSTAETDALTDLPNRYYMEQYILQIDETEDAVAFFLFDVNFLKRTNDREGHLAGDALLKRAAQCIQKCFAASADAKCFRYGGDEFAAILKNCREEDIRPMVDRFEEEQKNYDVSLAIGYSYTSNVGQTTMRALFDEADKKMYEQKKIIHAEAQAE